MTRQTLSRTAFAALCFIGLALTGAGQDTGKPDPDKAKKIADLEQQIQELQTKLKALKEPPPPATGAQDARRRPPAGRLVQAVRLALDRPGQHGRPHHRPRGLRGRPELLLRRHRVGRAAQDDQQRLHLRAPVRQGSDRVDRRRRRGADRPQHRLGRHRRGQPAQLRLLRRRRLQVDRRRQDLEEHGPQEVVPDRQDRHPSQGPEHRLRRRPRPALRPQRGTRPLQDHRRRQDLAARAARRRQDRRHRHRHAPDESRDADRRHLGTPARRVRQLPRRRQAARRPSTSTPPPRSTARARGLYKTTDGGKTWKKLDQGPAEGEDGPHRPRLVSQEPQPRLRDHRHREGGHRAAADAGVPRRDQRSDAARACASIDVVADGPAAKAGCKKGDVLLKLDGKDAQDARRSSSQQLQPRKPGDKVKLAHQPRARQGDEKELEVTLGTRPPPADDPRSSAAASASQIEEAEDGGLVVTEIIAEGRGRQGRAEGRRRDPRRSTASRLDNSRLQLFKLLADKNAGDKVKLSYQRGKEKKDVEVDARAAHQRRRPAGPTAAASAARRPTSRTSRAPTASTPAASTSPPTAAKPGRASTASTNGPSTSPSSASIRPTRSTSTSSASTSVAAPTAARPSTPRASTRACTPTSTTCGSTPRTAGT